MVIFRRTLRWLFIGAGIIAGLITAVVAVFLKMMVSPPRHSLWATPDELGLPYQNVNFPAQDGLRLSGWFLPSAGVQSQKGATIILVHGWLWNRLGTAATDVFSNIIGAAPVELLRLANTLSRDGYNVLMFDLRNHGESAASAPVTFGVQESNDLIGALAYLATRPDVNMQRIGVIGFSVGANTLLYTLAQTHAIKAAVAVQPTTAAVFNKRFGRDILGVATAVILPLVSKSYQAVGGLSLNEIRPDTAVSQAGHVPVLYIQGSGDPWGDPDDVSNMAAATPEAVGPLFVETTGRFAGYQYLIDNPKIATSFFEQHL